MMMRRLRSTLPSFVKKSDKLPPAIEEMVRIARADADGLIEALKKVGIWVEDLWDFSNTNERYPEAIPVLLEYLPKLKYTDNIEAVIRALSVKEAKGIACKAVIAAYHRGDKMRLNHHAICGMNLRATLTMDYIDDVVEIINESDQLVAKGGDAGHLLCFVEAICKWRQPAKRAIIQQKAGTALKKLWNQPMDIGFRKFFSRELDKLYK